MWSCLHRPGSRGTEQKMKPGCINARLPLDDALHSAGPPKGSRTSHHGVPTGDQVFNNASPTGHFISKLYHQPSPSFPGHS